ncbi:MAG TPA: hypothetical protein VGA36_11470 [Nitriliruptorales bacterium]
MQARGRVAGEEAGFLTIQFVAAVALSLVLLVIVVNAIVFQYARGVIATAVADGTRAGARAGGAPSTCEQKVHEIMEDLLSSELAASVDVSCTADAATVEAHASVRLQPWLPVLPSWEFTESASAPVELSP